MSKCRVANAISYWIFLCKKYSMILSHRNPYTDLSDMLWTPYTVLVDEWWTPYTYISDNLRTPYTHLLDNLWTSYTDFEEKMIYEYENKVFTIFTTCLLIIVISLSYICWYEFQFNHNTKRYLGSVPASIHGFVVGFVGRQKTFCSTSSDVAQTHTT